MTCEIRGSFPQGPFLEVGMSVLTRVRSRALRSGFALGVDAARLAIVIRFHFRFELLQALRRPAHLAPHEPEP